MKKIYLITILCFCFNFLFAAKAFNSFRKAKFSISDTVKKKSPTIDTAKQKTAKADSTKQIIRTAADLKSGTSQEVLSSFFKLAYQNLSDGHHFQFNSSLFAIKAKTDTSLWIDTNYNKHTFLRNMTLGIDIGLDSTNKFKSATLSVKYAIINNRDKSVFDFRSNGKILDSTLKSANHLYKYALEAYHKEAKKQNYNNALDYIYHDIHHPRPKLDSVGKRFIDIIDSIKNEKQFSKIKNFKALNLLDSLKDIYNTISGLMSQTSLWTIGGKVSLNQLNTFSKVNLNTEYLKGITRNNTSMGLELDVKGNLDIYDTTAMSQSYSRNVLSGSAGINWIIYKNKDTQKSYIEFKPALTYNNVLAGTLPGETKSKFTGDGVLRFRITDDLWIPFDIKYDPKAGKFFGFLNITSNFDWLGSKSKTPATN